MVCPVVFDMLLVIRCDQIMAVYHNFESLLRLLHECDAALFVTATCCYMNCIMYNQKVMRSHLRMKERKHVSM